MILRAEGALVSWSDGERTTVGVITEVLQSGRQIRVRLDDGSEQIFALDSGVIERFLFRPGDPVQVLATGITGVITGARQVGQKINYTVSLPEGIRNISESGLNSDAISIRLTSLSISSVPGAATA
jgi:hypothetical protein